MGVNPSIQMTDLAVNFQAEKSRVVESLEEYAVATAAAAYEYSGEQAPIRHLYLGVENNEVGNVSHCMDHKHTSFPGPTGLEITMWYTADVCMIVVE